ncbi:hypothetical protein K461DRAFT_290851 [Myriangium duriaei CBS 260.36]|uniref:Cohesin loading factor n=1 Tax=Myriangium duriaei CBS 260.36 TaxID=1168546 RepID=A0A9P4J5N6_9PEZI|nr:hypothetical protein K461DRAFT_290851 [Myriangium duriaei CBS 260.36]
MNNQQPGGHGWDGRYSYPAAPPQGNGGYGAPAARQPMVVIPRIAPEDMAQYYSQQQGYSQAPPNYHQSPGAYYQHPPPSPHGQPYSPHMQYMPPQQQILYNQPGYQMNFPHAPQNYSSPQMHHMPPPSYPAPSPIQQSQSLPHQQSHLQQPRPTSSQSGPVPPPPQQHVDQRRQSLTPSVPKTTQPAQQSQKLVEQRRQSSTPSVPKPSRPAQQAPPSLLAREPQVVITSMKSSTQSVKTNAPPVTKSISRPAYKSAPLASAPVIKSELKRDDAPANDVDYQQLLLSLADQYISAARSMSSDLTRSRLSTDLSKYHELMTSGLTCLDSAVNNWKISDPRGEAHLRLQYATLLLEETDNDDTALAVLSKGITVCERSKLRHQKFSMQHLLARVQFKTNPKAALKSIDSAIEDLVAFNNTLWTYVFRFLRVSLAMQRGATSDIPPTLQQLRSLVSLAESHRDIPVLVMAHILEASLYARSRSPESIEHAHRAIAAARSYQLDSSLQKIPQLRALVQFSDLCCDLATTTLDQLDAKVQVLQDLIDQLGSDSDAWMSSNFQIPTSVAATDNLQEETAGILRVVDSKASISFTWLNKNELFILGFLVSGAAKLQKNCLDERAEPLLSEGIKFAKSGSVDKKTSNKSLDNAFTSATREESLNMAAQILRVFALSIRSNWTQARQSLTDIATSHSMEAQEKYSQVLLYLDGVVKQAEGYLPEALACYTSSLLLLPPSAAKMTGPDLDLRILATLNRISILKSSPSTIAESEKLLDAVFPFCQNHPNPSIQSAANLLRTTTAPDLGMIKLKSFLQTSLACAQKSQNHQLISMVMNLMVVRFFGGIVGDQAEKSAMVGWQLSRKMRSPIWMAASLTNLAKCYNLHGKTDEAQKKTDDANAYWGKAPEGVRAHFGDGDM